MIHKESDNGEVICEGSDNSEVICEGSDDGEVICEELTLAKVKVRKFYDV